MFGSIFNRVYFFRNFKLADFFFPKRRLYTDQFFYHDYLDLHGILLINSKWRIQDAE